MADPKIKTDEVRQGEPFTPEKMDVDSRGKNIPVTQTVVVDREGGKQIKFEVTTN